MPRKFIVEVGGVYIGKRGGRRVLRAIFEDDGGKMMAKFEVVAGRRMGQTRTMTLRKFRDWILNRI